MSRMFKSRTIQRSAVDALLSLPEDCTELRLPFSAVLQRPLVRLPPRLRLDRFELLFVMIDEVRLGTSGGVRLACKIAIGVPPPDDGVVRPSLDRP